MKQRGEGQTQIPLEGFLARLKAGGQGFAAGFMGRGDWFGPGQPLPEMAPPEVEGRQFDLPVNYNPIIQTKLEGISFPMLRQMADVTDIIRILIENRKDVICAGEWKVQRRDAKEKKGKPQVDPNAQAIEEFFQWPDAEHSWSDWLRLLLEDLQVIDAPTLYVQKTNGGDLHALRPIDGATIKRIIDPHGWTPAPPLPAFQQILKGVPAVNYTSDELIYAPRNIRTNRIYALGRVEQVIVTMRLWLSRQASNVEYYDSGTVPDGFLSASGNWGAKEIAEYQKLFDMQLTGQLGERRKIKITPHDSKYTPTKEPALKNDYDEVLIRIACFCFGTSPTPFIRQMNRATGEVAKESAAEEGVLSDMKWVKRLMDGIIQRRLGYPELEFVWQDKDAADPLERAQVDQIYLQEKVVTPDEVRGDLGKDPLTPEERAALTPAPPPELGEDGKPKPPGAKPAATPPAAKDKK